MEQKAALSHLKVTLLVCGLHVSVVRVVAFNRKAKVCGFRSTHGCVHTLYTSLRFAPAYLAYLANARLVYAYHLPFIYTVCGNIFCIAGLRNFFLGSQHFE